MDRERLVNFLFNIEEIKLEPMYWKTAQQIRIALLPQQELETRRIYQQVKQDWDQKYATAEQWRNIAITYLQQQTERQRLQKELQKKKELIDERPPLAMPNGVNRVNTDSAEAKEEEIMRGRTKNGHPTPHFPTSEEVNKAKEEALKAAASMTGGKTNRNNSLNNSSNGMGSVHTPEFVPRGGNYQPLVGNGRQIPPLSYGSRNEWFCDNCQTSHGGPICPCPICHKVGHIYYLCPQRDEKESNGVVPDRNWSPSERLCEICGAVHAGFRTLGQKQNRQIQEMMAQRQKSRLSDEGPDNLAGIKASGTTPYCMHCGHAGNLHDPNCPLMREKSVYFQCSFCGEVEHRPDNCAARNKAYQEQRKAKEILMFLLRSNGSHVSELPDL